MKRVKKNLGSQLALRDKTITVFLAVVVLFLTLVLPAAALETGLEYGTITGLGAQDIRITIMKIVRIILGLVGIIAIVITIYGGYIWMTSAGNPEKIDQAKRILRNAAIGLVIIFSAFAIVSFIIGSLERALYGPGIPPGGPPPQGCINCGHLGSGIIENVYPVPYARDVARNTNVMVTFKVNMDPATIIKGAAATCNVASPCSGELIANNVLIFPNDDGEGSKLVDDEVLASSNDGRTFVFNPVDYLGNSVSNTWYSVKLTSAIEKDNGQSAFPGAANFFQWTFEIGTFLDLDPVEASNVFPQPDNQGDLYSTSAPVEAQGSILVQRLAQVAVAASAASPVILAGTTGALVSGSYNGSYTGRITVTINSGSNTANVFWSAGNPNNNPSAAITANTVNLGGGLTLIFDSGYAAGNQWGIDVVAAKTADTLKVDIKTYTFVGSGAIGNQIEIGDSTFATAANIAAKINVDNLAVTAFQSGSAVNLTAVVAGKQGNNIPIQASGSWAVISPLAGGTDAVLTPTTRDAPDKARNAIVVIDFNEAIDPAQANENNIAVEYDKPGAGWTQVAGSYLMSNQYKTVEILSNEECLDQAGQPITNSCGDRVFCWPYNDPDPYEATHYRVTVKAGLLKQCSGNGECTDPNFSFCVDTAGADPAKVCSSQSDGLGFHYPESRPLPSGLIDAASNSFNGNANTYSLSGRLYGQAEGPPAQSNQPAYSLNQPSGGTGDDLVWEFYLNRNIDLSPPRITEIGTAVGQTNVNLLNPVEATFDELMMSSSLKPGSNYRDGLCYCEANTDCNQAAGQRCDTNRNKCISDSEPTFCLEDNECQAVASIGGPRCVNQKYVNLVDRSVSPVGWWVAKENLDTFLPLDSYADQTKALVNHTRFIEVTNYGAEIGSGVKDVYQNCFLPSQGPQVDICDPATGAGCCGVLASRPYCCNGFALDQASWQNSECFTGY